MDAAEALADLTELSTQIRAAVMLDVRGEVAAAAGTGTESAAAMARGVRELLAAAEVAMGEEPREPIVQLQAAAPEGCVFVVRDDERVVAAVTGVDPTVGLVFYDLKTCLRHAAGEKLAPKPRARTAAPAAGEEGADG